MTLLPPASRLPDVMPWVEKNPGLDVVIDHMADVPPDDPKGFQLLLQMARYPRVYVKISHMWSLSHRPYPYPDMAEQIARLRRRFWSQSPDVGTDWPIVRRHLSYAQRVALYRRPFRISNKFGTSSRASCTRPYSECGRLICNSSKET